MHTGKIAHPAGWLLTATPLFLAALACGALAEPTGAPAATVTAEPTRSPVEQAALTAFEGWATLPYRREAAVIVQNDGTYATVKITAEFRPTADSAWLAAEAAIECRRIGGDWQCDNNFNFQLTPESQATSTAQQATQTARQTQEAQIQSTRQAEFADQCVPPETEAGGDGTLQWVMMEFWPEFDRPSVLVIYRMMLSPKLPLPTELTLRLPARAGAPSAFAIADNSGALINAEYARSVEGDWALINFTASNPYIQLEYYDPALAQTGNARHFEYQWASDYSVDTLLMRVQQPLGVSDMQITPEMAGPGLATDGRYYYCAHRHGLKTMDPSSLTLDYTLDTTP